MQSLSNLMITTGLPVYYSLEFKNLIEEHRHFLTALAGKDPLTIEPSMSFKYEKNFYGLLHAHGYEEKYFWTIMRINNFERPEEYDMSTTILLPPINEIEKLVQILTSQEGTF